MRIAFGTDEPTTLTDAIKQHLTDQGHDVVAATAEGAPWPDVGRSVGEGGGRRRRRRGGGVLLGPAPECQMAANKVPGVRAALCTDAETARGARRWNDANVLALSLRLVSAEVAAEMLNAFLDTEPDPDESAEIAKLS